MLIAHPMVIDPLYYQVFLNGRRVAHCVEANEEEGYVRCYILDERKQIVRDEERMLTQKLYGEVVVACDEYLSRVPSLFGQRAGIC